jgi:hypothetical protein
MRMQVRFTNDGSAQSRLDHRDERCAASSVQLQGVRRGGHRPLNPDRYVWVLFFSVIPIRGIRAIRGS